jgi:PAS domain S-box-containing protein
MNKFDAHLNQINQGFLLLDKDETILFCNYAAERLLNIKENCIGKKLEDVWPQLVHEKKLNPNILAGFALSTNNELIQFQITIEKETLGVFFWPVNDKENQAIEERIDFLLDHLPQGVIIAERKSPKFLYVNPIICSILGFQKKELLQLDLGDIHPPEEMARVQKSFQNMIEGEITFVPRMLFKRKNGTLLPMDIHAINIHYKGKECILGIFTDMTEMVARELANKEAYQQIKKQEQVLKEAQKISKMGIWEYNFKTDELVWSDEVHEIFETNKFTEKLTLESFLNFIHPDDRDKVNESYDNHVRFKEKYDIIHRIVTKKGNVKYLHESCQTKYNFKNTPSKSIGVVRDITEIKNQELSSQEQGLYLKQIAENIDELFWLRSADLNEILFINEAYESIYHRPVEEVRNNPQSFLQSIYPDDLAEIKEFFKTGELDAEHRIIRPNGEIRWLHSKTKWVKDKDGNNIANVGTSKDITVEKKQRLLIEERDERTKEITNYAKMVIWEIDRNGLYTFVSDNCVDIWGYDSEELTGKIHYYDLHPFESREDFKKATYRVMTLNERFSDLQNEIVTKDGNIRWMPTSGIPTYNETGEWKGYRGSDIDITEKKEAEDAVAEKNRQLNILIQSIPGAVFRTIKADPPEFTFVSDYIEEITGFTAVEFLESRVNYNDLIVDESKTKLLEVVSDAFKRNKKYQITYRIKDNTNQIRWILEIGEFTKVNNNIYDSVIDGVLFDISSTVNAEEEKVKAVMEATDAERSRIASEVHEGLQQLLVAAKINLELSKQQLRLKENNALLPAYNLVIGLLSDAIHTTRSISHNLMPKQVKEDGLIATIKSMIGGFQQSIKINFYAHDIDLRDDNIGLNLYRIIQEAMNNIIKHAQAKEVNINLTYDNSVINLSIEDNGIGFDFESIKNSSKGIGIKSMINRAKAIGAEIEINSSSNNGTLLMVSVPFIKQN